MKDENGPARKGLGANKMSSLPIFQSELLVDNVNDFLDQQLLQAR